MRDKLKMLRVERGFTQETIANNLKISRSTYTNIELGKKNPSLPLALKIKNVLDYDSDDIFLNAMCLKGTKKKL